MDERTLLAGYRRLLARLYSPEGYYIRCARHLDAVPIRRGSARAHPARRHRGASPLPARAGAA
jgi:hypothetical protein